MDGRDSFLIVFMFTFFLQFNLFTQNIGQQDHNVRDKELESYLEEIVKEEELKKGFSNKKQTIKNVFSILSFVALENFLVWKIFFDKKDSNLEESRYHFDKKGRLKGIFVDLSSVEDPSIAFNDEEIKLAIDGAVDSIVFMFDISNKTENLKQRFDEISSEI